MSQFVCLSGMPRSGSTLLSAILSQNPSIHAEGNSGVCQLLWDMKMSCTYNINEQLKSNRRKDTMRDLMIEIPSIYYKNVEEGRTIIVDKCRSWTKPSNVELLREYINPNIKIIVMERALTDVVESFYKLFKKNHWSDAVIRQCLNEMLEPDGEPIMSSFEGIKMARCANDNGTFLFIQYDILADNPERVIKDIYTFCGWEHFEHTFTTIVNKYPEDDSYYKIKGFHDVRPIVKKELFNDVLPSDILKKCNDICKKNLNTINPIY